MQKAIMIDHIREWVNQDSLTAALQIPLLKIEAICRIGLMMTSFFTLFGYCYGMSALVVYYFKNPNMVPEGRNVSDIKLDDQILGKLRTWHYSQWNSLNILKGAICCFPSIIGIKDYFFKFWESNKLWDEVEGRRLPAVMCLQRRRVGHAVVAYKVVRQDLSSYQIYIYDPNYPGEEKVIPIDICRRGLGFRYGKYTKFYMLIPDETLIGFCIGRVDRIEKNLRKLFGLA